MDLAYIYHEYEQNAHQHKDFLTVAIVGTQNVATSYESAWREMPFNPILLAHLKTSLVQQTLH